MTERIAILLTLGLFVVACSHESTNSAVEWQGRMLQEVRSLQQIPESIQSSLGVGRPGLDGVADYGQSFNLTDVVDPRLPRRRLLAAGHSDNTWLIAIERGGRVYNVEVLLFEGETARPTKTWVLPGRTRTLREVVQEIAQRGT